MEGVAVVEGEEDKEIEELDRKNRIMVNDCNN